MQLSPSEAYSFDWSFVCLTISISLSASSVPVRVSGCGLAVANMLMCVANKAPLKLCLTETQLLTA